MSSVMRGRLPRYECHKEVSAGQITGLEFNNERVTLLLENENVRIEVDHEWAKKHNVQIGGYYVVYADDYASFSPKKPFESGYTRKAVTSINVLPIPRG